MSIASTASWKKLVEHQKTIAPLHMRDMFTKDPGRFAKFSLRLGDLLLDYSKHRITDETMDLLRGLARETGVEAMRDKMFAGEPINLTEGRAVLHVALRKFSSRPIRVATSPARQDRGAAMTVISMETRPKTRAR